MVYVVDYGFLPQTLAGDGDPADVLVMVDEPTFTGCVLPVRPVGMMKMEDEGEDFKILAVPAGDKRFDPITRLDEVSPHRLAELEHFFKAYKTLDNTFPAVDGWFTAEEALAYVTKCHRAYLAGHEPAKR